MGIFSVLRDAFNYMFVKEEVVENKPNLGEDLRFVVQNLDFEEQLKPVLVTSIVAWPCYWIYRGYNWNREKGVEQLPLYIKKTYYRAKVLEIAIVLASVILAIRNARQSQAKQYEIRNALHRR